MIKRWLVSVGACMSLSAMAQTPWPQVQAQIYPMTPEMLLVRHEQSLLLGEGNRQMGLFFATQPDAYSEKVHTLLVEDALRKGWTLHSIMRFGANYNLTFTQGQRILDIRLSNTPQGVNAVYSIVPNQQPGTLAAAMPATVSAAPLVVTPEAIPVLPESQ